MSASLRIALEIRATLRAAADSKASKADSKAAKKEGASDASAAKPVTEAVKPRAAAEAAKPLSEDERTTLLAELAGLQSQLATLQGESPLILPSVDEQAVAAVVQDWTGVPVGRMVKNEVQVAVASG